jgi:uncharacterized protein (TIGR02301 family)
MFRRLTAPTLALLLAALTAAPAGAQFFQFGAPPPPTQPPPPRPLQPPQPKLQAPQQSQPPAPPPVVSAPYDHDLERLSEILGALHFLRGICGSNEGQKWRTEAQSLIEAEAPTGERHDQMVASFNRGYRGFQQRRPLSSSAVIWKRAPVSPARSPPATPINSEKPSAAGINPAFRFGLGRRNPMLV